MTYEELKEEHSEDVSVIEHDIKENPIVVKKHGKGFYYRAKDQTKGTVIIDETLSNIEKKCILAEEIGHHYTSKGNVLKDVSQEPKAREWGAIRLIDFKGFTYAFMKATDLNDMAEMLDVTVPTLQEYLKVLMRKGYLRDKTCYPLDTYVLRRSYIRYFSDEDVYVLLNLENLKDCPWLVQQI